MPIPTPGPGSDPPPFDPVRRSYLDALARRTAQAQGPVQALLAQRLAAAQAAYETEQAAACAQAGASLQDLQARFPDAAEALRGMWERGDFAGLQRMGRALAEPERPSALAGLLLHIEGGATNPAAASPGAAASTPHPAANPAAPRELRAVRQARATWKRLRVDRQLAQSLARLPDNPGPLNSQRLVLRCLQRLQALSPAYLARLMAQLDTLVWLEQASPAAPREGLPKAAAARGARAKGR